MCTFFTKIVGSHNEHLEKLQLCLTNVPIILLGPQRTNPLSPQSTTTVHISYEQCYSTVHLQGWNINHPTGTLLGKNLHLASFQMKDSPSVRAVCGQKWVWPTVKYSLGIILTLSTNDVVCSNWELWLNKYGTKCMWCATSMRKLF